MNEVWSIFAISSIETCYLVLCLQKVLNTTLLKMFSEYLAESYIITLCAVLKHGWAGALFLPPVGTWECSFQCYWSTSFLTVLKRPKGIIFWGITLIVNTIRW